MCVPVLVDGLRVGRFEVDIPYSQTYLTFRVMVAKETMARSPHADNFEIDEIRLPLIRRSVSIDRGFYEMNGTTQIAALLQSKGVPVYTNNLMHTQTFETNETVYSYRANKTTAAGLDEIFDLDQFVPE